MTPLDMVKEFAGRMDQQIGLAPGQEGFTESAELGMTLISEEYGELFDAVDLENDPKTGYGAEDTLKELLDLIYVAYGYAARRGWDVDSALVDLHQNNMDRCVWPDGTIHRREDGKILKNPNHTKINLEKYV